jgi:hypothetical protein
MDTLNLEFGFEFDVETRWQHVFAAEAARAGSGGERRGRKGVGSIATAQLSQLISRPWTRRIYTETFLQGGKLQQNQHTVYTVLTPLASLDVCVCVCRD